MAMPSPSWSKSATFFESFQHAVAGVVALLQQERNTRIIVGLGVAAILAALVLRLPVEQIGLIVFVSASVLAAEMFNTALESLSDLVWPEYREAVKVAKDLSAGAVLLLSAAALLLGVVLFAPPLLRLFFQ